MATHSRSRRVGRGRSAAQLAAAAATVALVLVSMTVVGHAQTTPGGTGDGTTVSDGTRGKVAGMGITRPGVPVQSVESDLPRLKQMGLNTVSIDVWWDVDSDTATDMHPGQITISDSDLTSLISAAKGQGMSVYLEPKLWCPNCSHTWRGVIQPSDNNAFFNNYITKFITKYAQIGAQSGISLFMIGSEMNYLQGDAPHWRQVAAAARTALLTSGAKITYEANWDVFTAVGFWDSVDILSVSAYYPLLDSASPSVSDIEAAWRQSSDATYNSKTWVSDIQSQASVTGKQVLFGEAGYLSSTYAGVRPYDPSNQQSPNMQEQADFYQALLETFEQQSWWAGVMWWEWYPLTGQSASPSQDMGYTPRDKIAEQMLKRWYAEGYRPPQGTRVPTQLGQSTPSTTAPAPQGPPPTWGRPTGNSVQLPGTTPGPTTPTTAPTSNGTTPTTQGGAWGSGPPQSGSPYAPPATNPYTTPTSQPPWASTSPATGGAPAVSPWSNGATTTTTPASTTVSTFPPGFFRRGDSAPVINTPPTTHPREAPLVPETLPSTTTTTMRQGIKTSIAAVSAADVGATPPLANTRPVVARFPDGGPPHNSRHWAMTLGGFAIGVPLFGALLSLVLTSRQRPAVTLATNPLGFGLHTDRAGTHTATPNTFLVRSAAHGRQNAPRSERVASGAGRPTVRMSARRVGAPRGRPQRVGWLESIGLGRQPWPRRPARRPPPGLRRRSRPR